MECAQVQEPLLPLTHEALEAVPQTPPDDVKAGMLWYLTSSFFFAAVGVCSKFLGNWGYPVFEITFFRSVIIACFSLSALTSAGTHLKSPSYTLAFTLGLFSRA
jgi:hypothetical protein